MNGILLNTVFIEFDKSEIEIFRKKYSGESLKDLYQENEGYSVYRDRDSDFIYTWKHTNSSKIPATPDYDYEKVFINLDNNTGLRRKIIEESLYFFFKEHNYNIFKLKYSPIYRVLQKKEKAKNLTGVSIKPYFDFSIDNHFSKSKRTHLLSISIQQTYKPQFTISESLIKSKHIDTSDWHRNHKGEIAASSSNLSKYLSATNQDLVYSKIMKQILNEKNEYEKVIKHFSSFKKIANMIYLPSDLKIKSVRLNYFPNTDLDLDPIPKPTYYFYNEKVDQGTNYYNVSVQKLKPASFESLGSKKIKIAIITPKEYEGSVGSFFTKFIDEFKKLFHIKNVDLNYIVINDSSIDSFTGAIQKIDYENTDLVITVVSEKDKELKNKKSPYFYSKAKLLGQRIPTQSITIEKIKKTNIYIKNNLSLNIYTKLGGTAWTIEKDEKNVEEIVIGIGSVYLENNKKLFGFANVFDHNGSYIVGDCSQLSSDDSYKDKLSEHIHKSINDVITQSENQQKKIRLIFHLRKNAGIKNEIAAINEALLSFSEYDIQYALVTLTYDHNYKFFKDEGAFSVPKGTFVQLDDGRALLHLGGKTRTPLQIKLDKRSTYKDIYAMSKQLFSFAHLSHRSFMPSGIPVTIQYPKIMSKLINELSSIDGWDHEQINNLKKIIWFI